MGRVNGSEQGGNVISLAAARRRLAADWVQPVPPRATPAEAISPPHATVYFVTGGRFEAMINGNVGRLGAGEFVRVPEGVAFGLSDVGPVAGSFCSHRFAVEVPSGFLRELAAALPPFATSFPARGTGNWARLRAVARRWGVALGSDEAA